MMALRLVLLPPLFLLVSVMVAECHYLPYLELSEEKLSEQWKAQHNLDTFIYTLEEPFAIVDMPPLQKVVVEVFANRRRSLDKFSKIEKIWADIVGAIVSDYATADDGKGIKSRDVMDREQVMSLLKEAVGKYSILPAFAVTRIPAVVTSGPKESQTSGTELSSSKESRSGESQTSLIVRSGAKESQTTATPLNWRSRSDDSGYGGSVETVNPDASGGIEGFHRVVVPIPHIERPHLHYSENGPAETHRRRWCIVSPFYESWKNIDEVAAEAQSAAHDGLAARAAAFTIIMRCRLSKLIPQHIPYPMKFAIVPPPPKPPAAKDAGGVGGDGSSGPSAIVGQNVGQTKVHEQMDASGFVLVGFSFGSAAALLPVIDLPSIGSLWEKHQAKETAEKAKKEKAKKVKPVPFVYHLENPYEIAGLPPLEKLIIDVADQRHRQRIMSKETMWANLIEAISPDYVHGFYSTDPVSDRRKVKLQEDVIPLLQKTVLHPKTSFLPAVAVTTFKTGATAAAAGAPATPDQEMLCIVKPFFDWERLSALPTKETDKQAYSNILWFQKERDERINIKPSMFMARPDVRRVGESRWVLVDVWEPQAISKNTKKKLEKLEEEKKKLEEEKLGDR
eukprot:GHVS01061483.1.p1 GENE.GHVS01061483.1~~GHVS01061483.1.p1  ORF type:complete len:621 (-),score=91.93 GHVS01061483.1:199-2061(-)